jgi:hypothetical protein
MLRQALLAVLGVEHVLLLDADPGEIESLPLDLFGSLRLLCLELGELLTRRLPLLARPSPVLRHLITSIGGGRLQSTASTTGGMKTQTRSAENIRAILDLFL